MRSDDRLGRHLETFFHDYLTGQRSVSPNTVLSYRDTLKLFLVFASKRHGRAVVHLRLDDLHVDVVLAFLDHLEQDRKNSFPHGTPGSLPYIRSIGTLRPGIRRSSDCASGLSPSRKRGRRHGW
jgi:Phage integrase, N-terminal SAM-like domain